MSPRIEIRQAGMADWPALWRIIEPVFRAGETYACDVDISEEEARRFWIEKPSATFVATGNDDEILGTYFIKPNYPGPGSHVCNCGYIVAENSRGQGIASAMCEHSQADAVRRGFRAMQFNFVVKSNEGAIRLWKNHGFDVIGTVPEAFLHSQLGFVDALIMFKKLD